MHQILPAELAPVPPQAAKGEVVVGFSGGLDSSVLLHLLASQSPTRARGLRAVHVHHGLHGNADQWAAHCEAVCTALDVPCRIVRVEVMRDAGSGPEAAAREARHRVFADALGEDDVLALGHHRDDQAETFLLRALRGSGPDGLASMRAWRRYGTGWLWRPLLDTPRAALQAYAHANALRWIEDDSNLDTRFDRNFLRRQVLPMLRERWPRVDAGFARSATLAAQAGELLEEDDVHALASARAMDARTLSVAALQRLPVARRARVLRRWIDALGLPPLPANGVAAIEAHLLDMRPDAGAQFAWQDALVRRWRDLLHADRKRMPLAGDYRVQWDGAETLALPTGATLMLVAAENRGQSEVSRERAPAHAEHGREFHSDPFSPFSPPALVHGRRGGERIVQPGRGHSHALKHILQEFGVPPWRRERLPLLSDARGTLLAAGDVAYSAAFDAWLRARGLRLECREGGKEGGKGSE